MHAWKSTQEHIFMESLPTELLIAIVDIIERDQLTLARCNRINKLWHNLTQVRLYREPSLLRLSALQKFLWTVDRVDEVDDYLEQLSSIHRPNSPSPTPKDSTDHLSPPSDLAPRIPPGVLVRSIDLSMIPHRWDDVQYETIRAIAEGCPWIEQLNLADCSIVRDNAVQILAENLGSLGKLRSLVLSGCTKITDLAVLSLCANVPSLENLELSGCDRITDVSIREIGSPILLESNPALMASLVGRSSQGVAPETEEYGGPHWMPRLLKSLDVSNCTRITDRSIKDLRMGATELVSLNLDGCYGILHGDNDLNEWEDMDDEFTDIDEDDAP